MSAEKAPHDPLGVLEEFVFEGRSLGRFYSLRRFEAAAGTEVGRLPRSLRIVLESVLRNVGRPGVSEADAFKIAGWRPVSARTDEVPFVVARVLLQDIAGIPVLMDLDAMRIAIRMAGWDPAAIEPVVPVELVIDHSIQVDVAGVPDAAAINARREFERNAERYAFLKWAAQAFRGLRIIPSGSGIIHQINLEHLARGVVVQDDVWYADTLVGTDSHLTMVNALGIVGWGVGGIEATAAMLGAPLPVLLPDVLGVHLHGNLREGVTATDLALTLTERLRGEKVVGKFLEFYGDGARALSVPDRATVANMAPEYGASLAYFGVDDWTCRYYVATGRRPDRVALQKAYLERQGLYGIPLTADCDYSAVIDVYLGDVEPCVAGPSKPQQYHRLGEIGTALRGTAGPGDGPLSDMVGRSAGPALRDGDIVIAAITSCTNTANPALMIAAGLLAQKAVRHGLRVRPGVKTSLAPGSRAVTEYLERAALMPALEALGFHVVGYGCTTCMGNSGPLAPEVERALRETNVEAAAVLSGNRNFEARIHPSVRANFLMSPPLVVAYALAGTVAIDLTAAPIGHDPGGNPVYLRDVWPNAEEVATAMARAEDPEIYAQVYRTLGESAPLWAEITTADGPIFRYDPESSYLQEPPFLDGWRISPPGISPIRGARALLLLGDSVTTDHISPVGRIAPESPAGLYLSSRGIGPADFNTYGARRGNHEVMMRGIFSNKRLNNRMVALQGGVTRHYPSGDVMPVYDAAMRYKASGTPVLIFGGEEYGAGSSRDWAAKGVQLLGVRAVIAKSFERIHRSNLVGMGVIPCEFKANGGIEALNIAGTEKFDLILGEDVRPRQDAMLVVRRANGELTEVPVRVRVDTELEAEYVRHGGILPYLLRKQIEIRGDGAARPARATVPDQQGRTAE